MSQGFKSRSKKVGVLVLLLLLCLPCSLKKVLKQELPFPVATNTQQHNQERSCPVAIQESGPCCSTAVTVKKHENTAQFFVAAYPTFEDHLQSDTLPLLLFSTAVPLYIRHEQYLI